MSQALRSAEPPLLWRALGRNGVALAIMMLTPLVGAAAAATLEVQYGYAGWLADAALIWTLIYILAAGTIVGLALIVTHAVSLLAGFAFGPLIGALTTTSALTLGAAINYQLCRMLAGESILELIERRPKLKRLYRLFHDVSFSKETTLVTLVRISPMVPYTATNLVLAGAKVPFRPFVVGSAIGILPQASAVAFIGSQMQAFSFDRPEEAWFAISAVIVTVLAVILLMAIGRRALKRIENA